MAKAAANGAFDGTKFINGAQIGGVDQYVIDDGLGRGVRALCVNTGAGLRYRVLVDRGFYIDHAFFNNHSLAFLTYKNVTPPTRALDRGFDWLKSFPGGLLTTCGPFNIGDPGTDDGEELGLHGTHSNSAASIESIIEPDPRNGRNEIRLVGRIKYGAFYGPWMELRRTITSTLGSNAIDFVDELSNPGNKTMAHAWLLHINFGHPLLDAGAEICCDTPRVEPMTGHEASEKFFARPNVPWKKLSGPNDDDGGKRSIVGFTYPRADRNGHATVAIANRKLGLAVAVRYNTRQFPRCGNWQHLYAGEYVTALEPMNGTVVGRAKDRANKRLDFLKPGETRTYRYRIEVASDRAGIDELLRLNKD